LRRRLVEVLRDQGDEPLADALDHGQVLVNGSQIEVRSLPDYQVVLELGLATIQEAIAAVLPGNARVTLGSDLGANERVASAGPAAAVNAPRPSSGPGSGAAAPAAGASEVVQRALADPEVQRIQKLFAGQIREVRNLRGYTT
jgi:hypothetical protein